MAAFVQTKERGEDVSGSEIQVTFDAAPTDGNLLVAMVSQQGAPTFTLQSGWIQMSVLTSSDRGGMFYKVAGVGESATQNPVDSSVDASGAPWAIVITEYAVPVVAVVEVNGSNADNNAAKSLTSALVPNAGIRAIAVGGSFSTRGTNTTDSQTIGGLVATERGDPGTTGDALGTQCSLWDLEIESTLGSYFTTATVTGSTFQGAIFLAIFELAPLPPPPKMVRANQRELTNAILDVLRGAGIEVGDATAPDCDKPYTIVSAVSGPRYSGPMDNTEIDGVDRFQFSSIGETRDQADRNRELVRDALTVEALDAQFVTDTVARRTMMLVLDIPRGTRRDERGLPDPVFLAVDQYLIETTPSP